MRRVHVTCTVPDCERPHKARGFCPTHYAQHFRGRPVTEAIRSRVREKPEECSEAGCLEPVKAKGLCRAHYQRLLRHGHTRYRDRKRPPKPCSVAGCENHLYARQLCHRHYVRERMWARYGIDAHRYQTMLDEQNGLCAICGRPERLVNGRSGKVHAMAVDHCHSTGKVRQLLCSNCNRGLGLFYDDPDLLFKAARYVLRYRAED